MTLTIETKELGHDHRDSKCHLGAPSVGSGDDEVEPPELAEKEQGGVLGALPCSTWVGKVER